MKLLTSTALLAVLFLVGSNPAQAEFAPRWQGLWQGIDGETGFTSFFLMIREDSAELYNALWVQLPEDQIRIEGNQISFQFLYKRRSWMPMQGEMRSGTLTGRWERFHPQFEIKGNWHAVRITSAPGWQPWEFMEKVNNDTLDLAGLVAEGMPYAGFEAFRSYWNQHIEKRFFPLLVSSLYADQEGLFRESLKESRLRKVFDSLTKDPDGFQHSSRDLAENAAVIKSQLEEAYPWLAIDKTMVIGVSGGDFDFKVAALGPGHSFIYISSDWLNTQPDEVSPREYLAQGLIYGQHRYDVISKITLGLEVFRRGMALTLSRQALDGAPSEEGAAGQAVEASDRGEAGQSAAQSAEAALLEKFPVPLSLSFPEFLKGKSRKATLGVALKFVDQLKKEMSDEELYRLDDRSIHLRFRRFLQAAQPASASASARN